MSSDQAEISTLPEDMLPEDTRAEDVKKLSEELDVLRETVKSVQNDYQDKILTLQLSVRALEIMLLSQNKD